jgi:hypothetical protein
MQQTQIERAKRVNALLPVVSALRHSTDSTNHVLGALLQATVRDVQRLLDVETFVVRHMPDSDLKQRLLEMLERA